MISLKVNGKRYELDVPVDPVSCAACHTVNGKGVPVQLQGADYYNDYWASVTLIHFMREGDEKMACSDLVRKYPYRRSSGIVASGWK